MSSNSVAAWKVASLLKDDTTLLQNWEFFYQNLRLESANRIPLRNDFVGGKLSPFSLLDDIIQKWVGANGKQGATIEALGKVLKDTRHQMSHDILLQKFPNHNATITFNEEENGLQTGASATVPSQEQIMQYESQELKNKTAQGGISILELIPHKQAGHGRLFILTYYLLGILSKIGNNPVAIISINGRQRSGKSFLATQMVKYLKANGGDGWLDTEMTSGFTFNDSEKRVTSGIQVWHEPLQVEHGEKTIYVIVMDTQGLHDDTTGTQENAVIFGLSVLLSSVFIYNERNVADDSLQYLRSFLEFARFTAAGGGEHRIGAENPRYSNSIGGQLKFQKLILLFRDWRASREYKCGLYEDHHCPPGQVANLKNAKFDITPDMHPNAAETRGGIESCFENISVYAMSGPGIRYPDMSEYTHSSSWEPDFRTGVLDFAEALLSRRSIANSTKKVFGEEVTGEELKPFVSRWAELIQGMDGVIQSQTIFETSAELFCHKKVYATQKEYETVMSQFVSEHNRGIANEVFQEFHTEIMKKLESRFALEGTYGGNEMLQKQIAEFRQKINGVKNRFVETNIANIHAESERQLREQGRIEVERKEAELQKQRERRRKHKIEAQRREEELLRQREEERQNAERAQQELRRKAEEAWNATLRQAEARVNDARIDLTYSQARRQHIIDSRLSYTKPVHHKKTVRFLGITVSPSYYTIIEHDPVAYQAALNLAEEEVGVKQQRVTEAEQNLQQIQNSRPS